MKSKMTIILLLTLSIMLIGCSEKEVSDNSSGGGSAGIDTEDPGDTDNGNTDNTGGTNTTGGGNCSGTTADGTGSGYSIHHFNLLAAGGIAWLPGTYSDALATQTMPTVQEASIIFRSDSRLKVRLKIQAQEVPPVGEQYCYGRQTGMADDAHYYTKLKFRVHLRDVFCSNPDPSNSNNCLSGFYLGGRYGTQYIDPINVGSCSPQIDVGSIRNSTSYGTVVEVEDVKADSTCQYNGDFCPAGKPVRSASCWRMTMQVVTDYTQDFK